MNFLTDVFLDDVAAKLAERDPAILGETLHRLMRVISNAKSNIDEWKCQGAPLCGQSLFLKPLKRAADAVARVLLAVLDSIDGRLRDAHVEFF